MKRSKSTQLYPYQDDPQRNQFSRLIEPHLSRKWCIDSAAQCDPKTFNTHLQGKLIVNEPAKTFGFLAQFDAGGFGGAAEKRVAPRTAAYLFRERSGIWEHREFAAVQFQRLLHGRTFDQLIRTDPDFPFQPRGN